MKIYIEKPSLEKEDFLHILRHVRESFAHGREVCFEINCGGGCAVSAQNAIREILEMKQRGLRLRSNITFAGSAAALFVLITDPSLRFIRRGGAIHLHLGVLHIHANDIGLDGKISPELHRTAVTNNDFYWQQVCKNIHLTTCQVKNLQNRSELVLDSETCVKQAIAVRFENTIQQEFVFK